MTLVADIKHILPGWMTPQFVLSATNFLAIIFTGGMIYSTAQGEIATNKQDIKDLKSEVRVLRQQDTSIAVLKADTGFIKDSIARIESRIDRLPTSPAPR
jgi:hypothetical protein